MYQSFVRNVLQLWLESDCPEYDLKVSDCELRHEQRLCGRKESGTRFRLEHSEQNLWYVRFVGMPQSIGIPGSVRPIDHFVL